MKILIKIDLKLDTLTALNLWHHLLIALVKIFQKNSLEKWVKFSKETQILLVRKGVYPHDCMDNFERFNEVELPPSEEFYSLLNDSNISNKDYEHAQKIMETFQHQKYG